MRRFFSFLLMISMFCGAMAELKYVEISTKQNLPTIQIKSIDDFEKIINSYNISIVFLNNMERTGSEALVMTNGTYFSFPMEGYKTLSDYRAGKNAKFKQAENKSKVKEGNVVYWTTHGKNFHTHEDCQALDRSDTLLTGSATEAMDAGKGTICKFCEKKDSAALEAAQNAIDSATPAFVPEKRQAANKSKEDVKIVYWTEHGKKFHTHEDCQALDRSDTLLTGSATEAMDAGKGTICKFCEKKDSAALEVAQNAIDSAAPAVNQ